MTKNQLEEYIQLQNDLLFDIQQELWQLSSMAHAMYTQEGEHLSQRLQDLYYTIENRM